jgi:Domain of unknown function (DUF4111)/Nucleotidyltransferase domain
MALPPIVRQVADTYLGLADAEAPGLVEGLYLVGSVALDDFRPHTSDIDFVAVTSRELSAEDLSALRRVHAGLVARHRRPYFDGSYVTWSALSADPALARTGADCHEGWLRARAGTGCDPVAWHTLAGHGVAVRGPRPADLEVWTDQEALAAWTHRNLDDYWRRCLRHASRLLSGRGLWCLTAAGPAWGVLGVSRLHYTLATGRITSKTGAGRYAREAFEQRWHRIIDECLRIRCAQDGPSRYGHPLTRRRDALHFVAMAIDEAHRAG